MSYLRGTCLKANLPRLAPRYTMVAMGTPESNNNSSHWPRRGFDRLFSTVIASPSAAAIRSSPRSAAKLVHFRLLEEVICFAGWLTLVIIPPRGTSRSTGKVQKKKKKSRVVGSLTDQRGSPGLLDAGRAETVSAPKADLNPLLQHIIYISAWQC